MSAYRARNLGLLLVEWMESRCLLSGSITGEVFNDLNGDGRAETGEPGIRGFVVYLDKNNNGVPDAGEPQATTNSVGIFSFTGLAAGTYAVDPITPAYVQTSAIAKVTLSANQAVTGIKIGDQKLSIAGNVFDDLVNTGVPVSLASLTAPAFSAPPLPGWTVFVDLSKNDIFNSRDPVSVTDANGNYRFTNLNPGSYQLGVIAPAEWTKTSAALSTPVLVPSTNFATDNLSFKRTATDFAALDPDGTLVVEGTPNDDNILIQFSLNSVGTGTIAVSIVSTGSYTKTFTVTNFKRVFADGLAGDDQINCKGILPHSIVTSNVHPAVLPGPYIQATLIGGEGDDTLYAGASEDWLYGGSGNDYLVDGLGRDHFSGGTGNDIVDYSHRLDNLKIFMDNSAPSGNGNEGDTFDGTVETLYGGHGNDTIVGTNGNNSIYGNGGADSINGLGGTDALFTGPSPGGDTLNGSLGNHDYFQGDDNSFPDLAIYNSTENPNDSSEFVLIDQKVFA